MRQLIIAILLLLTVPSFAQPDNVDYKSQRKYRIGKIDVEGSKTIDPKAIILLSGLAEGQEISVPGSQVSEAMRKLWDQKVFSNVEIFQSKISGEYIFLVIRVDELPRLNNYRISNVSKGEHEKLNELINLYQGKIINESLKFKTKELIRNFFVDKGYIKASVEVQEELDTLKNNAKNLRFVVEKGNKFKINDIIIHGNESLSDGKILRSMKETKRKRWWHLKRSKYMVSTYKSDKAAVIDKYNEIGLRDAIITSDTIYDFDKSTINIEMTIDEGEKYYFGDFTWSGNVLYRNGQLDTIVGIDRGTIYSRQLLDSRLSFSASSTDVTSYYMDRGYLFFQLIPTEHIVYGDSNFINYDVRIHEGKLAYVRDIRVSGNTKTNDHVIYREIRTKPGDVFSRQQIIRTQQELNNLGYFNPETMGVNPIPNPADGTVDIEYKVEEKPSDQIELSGGWGANRIVGTLGLVFNNFSARKIFDRTAWQPLPSGDGQRLSIRAQSNGLWYQSYNFSFTEPWLGGKRPNSLTVSAYHSILSNGERKSDPNRQDLKLSGVSIGLGKRNKWPDDYFQHYTEFGYQRYKVNNYGSLFALDSGISKSFYVKWQLSRNSINKPLYPESGSQFKFVIKVGLPLNTLLNPGVDFSDESVTAQEKYAWLEYIKPKFTASWFTHLSKETAKHKLVLNPRVGFGFLLPWNNSIGTPPFERFYLGGSGLTGFNNLDGREIIALRGYDDNWLSATTGSAFIAKYTLEVRYPISLNPSATVYALAFAEAGSTWDSWEKFNPFNVKRSAGFGLRIFLPMFGLMGLDYGFGFDSPDMNHQGFTGYNLEAAGNKLGIRSQFHFTIGMNLGEL